MLAHTLYKIRWYIGVAILLCGFLTMTKYLSWVDHKLGFSRSSSVPQKVSASTVGPTVSTSLQLSPPIGVAGIQTQLAQVKKLLHDATNYQVAALEAAVTWQVDIESFRETPLNSSAGSGGEQDASQKLFEQLAYVETSDRMNTEQLAGIATRIETLNDKVETLTNQPTPSALTAGELAEAIELHTISMQASEQWKLALKQALAIKHMLSQQLVPVEPESDQLVTVGDKISDAAAVATLSDLDEQIERKAAEKEIEIARAEEKERLIVEATRPDVKALLAPFLAPRYLQPRAMAGTTLRFKKTADKTPISLSALNGINALTESEAGLVRLATLGGHWQLSEPKWSVKSQSRYWSDDDREMLGKAQDALRTYGPILVQQGLLAQ